MQDVTAASKHIKSNLFRPPYGRLRSKQAKKIGDAIDDKSAKIVMWDILSGDFDETLSKEQCLKNVMTKTGKGSIIVFHDSEKAFARLQYVLPLDCEGESKDSSQKCCCQYPLVRFIGLW